MQVTYAHKTTCHWENQGLWIECCAAHYWRQTNRQHVSRPITDIPWCGVYVSEEIFCIWSSNCLLFIPNNFCFFYWVTSNMTHSASVTSSPKIVSPCLLWCSICNIFWLASHKTWKITSYSVKLCSFRWFLQTSTLQYLNQMEYMLPQGLRTNASHRFWKAFPKACKLSFSCLG